MRFAFIILLLAAAGFQSCTKNKREWVDPPPSTHVKLPHGQPIGDLYSKTIGPEGGVLSSVDGTMTVIIPSGAVSRSVQFSIQQVENVFKKKTKAYRLKPEGVEFLKPVTLEYRYSNTDMYSLDPRYFFFACQDADGYVFSANKTKLDRTRQVITVTTKHFSDWSFYSMYEFYSRDINLVDGKAVLSEDETLELHVIAEMPTNSGGDLDPLLVSLTPPTFTSISWQNAPQIGTVTPSPSEPIATYRAPRTITSSRELVVTATMTGNLGTDNEGNPVRQLQLIQPIQLQPGDYFILQDDGVEMVANQFSADLIQLYGVQINARFPNGTNLSAYTYATTVGGYGYGQHGTPGKTSLELVPGSGTAYVTFRPENCDQPGSLLFSPGSFKHLSLANSVGEYFEGSFEAVLYRVDYCQGARTKTVSGRYRFKRKV